jgi:hypothetical protein
MYVLSSDKFPTNQPPPSYGKAMTKKSRKLPIKKQHSYDKWVRFRERIQETNINREALIKEIAEFLRKVLPKDKSHEQVFPKIESSEQTSSEQTSQQRFEVLSTSDIRMIYRVSQEERT